MLGWTTTLYFAKQRQANQQQAWLWWHGAQASQLHNQAESIRDDVLQQTFAFRRYLENTLIGKNSNQTDVAQAEQWLGRLQALYQSLEQLSNQLSPPFITDSLPLALQFIVTHWQQTHPGLIVQLKNSPSWTDSSLNNNQIILSITIRILELLPNGDDSDEQRLDIALDHQQNSRTLTLTHRGGQPQNAKSLDVKKITHLKEIFHTLTSGKLDVSNQGNSVTCQLSWQDQENG
ncbi:hypothetical protein D0962_02950 [Leptolyngbyaceae cyanobacterium CCMR0082]|uniref:Uncharacterized protein n=2 Tax=Adonisia turfae TaxID=2950184 RepID=A0A6M0S1D2_9CYAN|nr:hypothetical protein [Adonisia turfae]NEZ59544.1 hypothetical protein [Adonisia turfae CCMR0081]NEZ61742.1 hypothetical protein [Adonisia turfae CCMR0082]